MENKDQKNYIYLAFPLWDEKETAKVDLIAAVLARGLIELRGFQVFGLQSPSRRSAHFYTQKH